MINYLKVTDKNFQKDSFIFDQISQIFSFKENEVRDFIEFNSNHNTGKKIIRNPKKR